MDEFSPWGKAFSELCVIDTINRKMVINRNMITEAKDTPVLIQSLENALTHNSDGQEVHM